jgi:hypothetical protein
MTATSTLASPAHTATSPGARRLRDFRCTEPLISVRRDPRRPPFDGWGAARQRRLGGAGPVEPSGRCPGDPAASSKSHRGANGNAGRIRGDVLSSRVDRIALSETMKIATAAKRSRAPSKPTAPR